MSARRTERLLNLVIALSATRRPMLKDEIRRAVPQYDECESAEAFDRMFERDKDELRDMGVPVVSEQRSTVFEDEVGYRVDRGAYALPHIEFTPAELTVLGIAARAWQQARLAGAAGRGLTKLRSLRDDGHDDLVLGIEPRVAASEPAFLPLYEAVRDARPVSFSYSAGAAPGARRRVEPWGITSWHGHWYVVGHDLDRGERRVFRVSRIQGKVSVAHDQAITHPAPPDLDLSRVVAQVFPDEPEVDVVVELAPGRGQHLRQQARPVDVVDPVEADDAAVPDRVVLSGRVQSLADEIAALGADARVISPPPVAARVRDLLLGARDAHRAWLADPASNVEPRTSSEPEPSETKATRPARTPPPGAGERLSRLLTLIPYLQAHQGIPTAEAAARFGLTEGELVKDLETAFLCGLPGHMPDDLIEAEWESGRIFLRNADAIAAPLRLSRDEATALVVGLRMLSDVPGVAEQEAVAGALEKLRNASAEAAAGADAVEVAIDTSPQEAELLEMLRGAVADHAEVHLSYLVATRDERTERDVAPMRVLAIKGRWYLEAWCRAAGGVRTFRLDRIAAAHLTGADGTPPPDAVGLDPESTDVFQPASQHLAVTLELSEGARWVQEYYAAQVLPGEPGTGSARGSDPGRTRVLLRTGEPQLVVRLALRLGGEAVVTHPRDLALRVVEEAERALALG